TAQEGRPLVDDVLAIPDTLRRADKKFGEQFLARLKPRATQVAVIEIQQVEGEVDELPRPTLQGQGTLQGPEIADAVLVERHDLAVKNGRLNGQDRQFGSDVPKPRRPFEGIAANQGDGLALYSRE